MWLIVVGVLVLLLVALVVANEVRVQRRRRALLRLPSSLAHTIRRHPVDVIELDWSEPAGRERLGRLGQ